MVVRGVRSGLSADFCRLGDPSQVDKGTILKSDIESVAFLSLCIVMQVCLDL